MATYIFFSFTSLSLSLSLSALVVKFSHPRFKKSKPRWMKHNWAGLCHNLSLQYFIHLPYTLQNSYFAVLYFSWEITMSNSSI